MDFRKILMDKRSLIKNVLDQTDDFVGRLYSKELIEFSELIKHHELHFSADKVDNVLRLLLFRSDNLAYKHLLLWLEETEQRSLLDALAVRAQTPPEASTDVVDGIEESGESDCESLSATTSPVLSLPGRLPHQDFVKERLQDTSNVYQLSTPVRGVAMLFINSKFVTKSARNGSEHDIQNLHRVLSWLGYTPLIYSNLTKEEVIDKLKQQRSDPKHWEYGSFILCFLSHGDNRSVFSSDEKKIYVSELMNIVDSYHFPALAAKPKFLFIDANMGRKADVGLRVYGTESFSKVSSKTRPKEHIRVFESSEVPPQPPLARQVGNDHTKPPTVSTIARQSVACKIDIAVCLSAFPHYTSLHNNHIGSIATRVFTEVLLKHAHHEHLLTLLRRIRRKLSLITIQGQKQIVTTMETLSKDFYLFPIQNI